MNASGPAELMSGVSLVATSALTMAGLEAVRRLLDRAYDGDFSDDDWAHALGGTHAIVARGDEVFAHGSVVQRTLFVGSRAIRAGYVEAIGVLPWMQRSGLGSKVLGALAGIIASDFELGVLSTGQPRFYQRLGWARWQGPTFVNHADGMIERSADDDDGIMVYRTPLTGRLAFTAALTCEARAGDAW